MWNLNLERVRANARQATTEDLLDRVTVYRAGMEPAALEVLEAELRGRGVTAGQQVDHEARRGRVLTDADGSAVRCSRCLAPAVEWLRTWHRLFGLVPLWPCWRPLCAAHAAAAAPPGHLPASS